MKQEEPGATLPEATDAPMPDPPKGSQTIPGLIKPVETRVELTDYCVNDTVCHPYNYQLTLIIIKYNAFSSLFYLAFCI